MKPAGLSLLALVLGACLGGGPKPSFYALSSASAATSAPLASKPELGLAVGPIEFPRYLDRSELVTRDGANQLVVADAHRWGGSLRNEILRVVSDDLGRLLGTSRVVMYPTEPRFKADYRVLLDIREFERSAGGDVVLRVRWTLASANGAAVIVEESRIAQSVASSSWNDVVAAESAALATLTRQVAERIAALR
ncbi:MAG: PqiC family protein [Myxococcota bacterium]